MEELETARGQEALEPASTRRTGPQDAHNSEPSAWFEDPVGLSQDTGRVAELIEGAAADGARKRGVEERKVLRVRPNEGWICPDRASSPVRLSQHGGGDVYSGREAAVEVAAQAAGIQTRGATQIEVAAFAVGTDEAGDDLELPLIREGFTSEEA